MNGSASRSRTLKFSVPACGFTVEYACSLRAAELLATVLPLSEPIPLSSARARSRASKSGPGSAALPSVHHGHCESRSSAQVPGVAHVASDPDALVRLRVEGDQRFVRAVIHVGEVLDLPPREVLERCQEAAEARERAEPGENAHQFTAVRGLDRPDHDHSLLRERDPFIVFR